jgi:tetratricopeptide (TPR) repeat protein
LRPLFDAGGGRDFIWSVIEETRLIMKGLLAASFVMSAAMSAALATAQTAVPVGSANLSRTEIDIADARKTVLEKPAHYSSYNLLAAALVRRAQETLDNSDYAEAESAVKKSLELSPNNFDTEKIEVSILLGEHEFPAALEAAKKLNKRTPDDVMVYGMLTDANVELGNYGDAEDSAQWMLNLRPGNLPALTRAAHLRELFGDAEGAYELMSLGYQSMPPTDIQERAWALTQMGHLRFESNDGDGAEKLLQQALTTLPEYSAALTELASMRVAQGRYQDAVDLLKNRGQSSARPSDLYELAEAQELAGHDGEAKKTFAEFEAQALAESGKRDNANRELVFYYIDHTHQPAKGLKIAEQEYAWRHDVYTLDAYAWALHSNGQDVASRKQIEAALEVGIRDARMFRHAGVIALKSGDRVAGELYLKQAAELNSGDAVQARTIQASLTGKSGRR